MKSFGIIFAAITAIAGIFLAKPDETEAEKIAKARQRVAEANGVDQEAQDAPPIVQAVAPLVKPNPAPTVEPSVEPTPTPVAPPAEVVEWEAYQEQVCDGTSCRIVTRYRPVRRAAKAVASVLVAPIRAIRSANCPCGDACTCDPCTCGEAAAGQGEVYAAPGAMDFQGGQPVRNAGRAVARGAVRVVTAPIRVVQRVRENQPVRTFFRNGGVFRRGCR